ncbi:MAG: thermopsin family protease, partial [Thermoplasmataceae archaeon]
MNATFESSMMQRGITNSINPYLYSSEPAPMGIADYGIGQNNIPYETNRTSYTGTVNISSITTFNSSWPQDSMGFQLNLNLVFVNSGIQYVFWVQDVALLNTTSHQVQFLDNIWNSSSPQAVILNSTVSGNGTVGKSGDIGFYYCVPGSEPGNLVTLSYPTTITMGMNASIDTNGYPQVNFSYNDGY